MLAAVILGVLSGVGLWKLNQENGRVSEDLAGTRPSVTQPAIPPMKPWRPPPTVGPRPSAVPGPWRGFPPGAVAAVDEWLALLDGHRYREGWDKAHERLKTGGTLERFEAQVREIRTRAGPVSSRENALHRIEADGQATIKYEVVSYPTGYSETVGARTDSDGAWRVDSYQVRLQTPPGTVLSVHLAEPAGPFSTGVRAELHAAAEAWLALVDGQRYGEAWDHAHEHLKGSGSREAFETDGRELRSIVGPVVSRKFGMYGGDQGPGGAILWYYVTEFEQEGRALEYVGVVRDPDGPWRVASYLIRLSKAPAGRGGRPDIPIGSPGAVPSPQRP
jgi:hypothetical protein